jgi:hypothetical protein
MRWGIRLSGIYVFVLAIAAITFQGYDDFDRPSGHTEKLAYWFPTKRHVDQVEVWITPKADHVVHEFTLPLYAVGAFLLFQFILLYFGYQM